MATKNVAPDGDIGDIARVRHRAVQDANDFVPYLVRFYHIDSPGVARLFYEGLETENELIMHCLPDVGDIDWPMIRLELDVPASDHNELPMVFHYLYALDVSIKEQLLARCRMELGRA